MKYIILLFIYTCSLFSIFIKNFENSQNSNFDFDIQYNVDIYFAQLEYEGLFCLCNTSCMKIAYLHIRR